MENFVTVTGRSTRAGGSSHASSSCAAGKAPAIPHKRCSKASGGRKRKRPKTTANAIEVEAEPLTYHEPESEPEQEPLPPRRSNEPIRIKLHGQWYRKVADLAGQRRGKKKSSHIWDDGKGFAIVHEVTGTRYYYCCQCLDEKKDTTYRPLSKKLSCLY